MKCGHSAESLCECPEFITGLFEVQTHTRSSFSAGHVDEAAAAHFGQFRKQAAWTAIEVGFLFGASVQQSDEQISHHTDESVNGQLLIGPVKLRPGGEQAGIFQVAKRRLHLPLAAIGFNNLRRSPLGTVCN